MLYDFLIFTNIKCMYQIITFQIVSSGAVWLLNYQSVLGYFEEAENGTLHQAYCVKARNIFSYTRTSGLNNEFSISFNFFPLILKISLKHKKLLLSKSL